MLNPHKQAPERRTMRVEANPQPMAAHAIHIRGWKSLDVIVAGIWQVIFGLKLAEKLGKPLEFRPYI